MPKQISHNQRSLDFYRKQGYTCAMVERWCSFTHTRRDLWGIIDMLAIHPELPTLGVQICGRSTVAAHRRKIMECEVTPVWLASNQLVIISWQQPNGPRTKWVAKEEWIEWKQLQS
jgi:hypothetical protein